MLSHELRQGFIAYFKKNGHTHIHSSPVVPHDDPTLLFNNAGMNQFKDVFTGKGSRDYSCAVTSQKCIRVGGKHNDLDNVGHTARHLTFFEMLGNFSFTKYFKKEAIAYAWEATLNVLQIPEEKIWATIYEEDEEAFALWEKFLPQEKIIRMGKKDNFWEMGNTGPCGPCSELFFDRGSSYGNARSPKEDLVGDRFLEFWNLVFMQHNRNSSGKLSPLKNCGIDTGAGLERVLCVKNGVDSVFETDILQHLIRQVEKIARTPYEIGSEKAAAFHVVADHIRSLCFAIADGAQPSNLDRGYVLRKLLRRSVRYGKMLGIDKPFLSALVPSLIEVMGRDFPELAASEDRICEILTLEEEGFIRTLQRGGNILYGIIAKGQSSSSKEISGEEAFKLKDTYGFPLEEILLIAKDNNLRVNLDAYQILEEQAKERSRGKKKVICKEVENTIYGQHLKEHGATEFVGYTHMKKEGSIMSIIIDGQFVDKISEGESGEIFLNKTPFYAEKGGQIADKGTLSHQKALFEVEDCQTPHPGVISHRGTVKKGTFVLGEPLLASINSERRKAIANHHTATHLLHWALQQVLGPHVRQAGSLVESERLRFDFYHHKAVSPQEILDIEQLVNEKIRENESVSTCEISYEEAQKSSEIKQFFGDKYGSVVRVVDINYSKELCGGTHTAHLGTIGLFRIIKESSIASGVRRIEAASGKAAEEFMYQNEQLLRSAAETLKTAPQKLIQTLIKGQNEKKRLEGELKHYKERILEQIGKQFLSSAREIKGISFLCEVLPSHLEQAELFPLAKEVSRQNPDLLLLLAYTSQERCHLLMKVPPKLIEKGIAADTLIKKIAPLVGGSGGGKKENAQAGGTNPSGVGEAFIKLEELLKEYE